MTRTDLEVKGSITGYGTRCSIQEESKNSRVVILARVVDAQVVQIGL